MKYEIRRIDENTATVQTNDEMAEHLAQAFFFIADLKDFIISNEYQFVMCKGDDEHSFTLSPYEIMIAEKVLLHADEIKELIK